MPKEYQITGWIPPSINVETVDGVFSGSAWLESEAGRINHNTKRRAVIRESEKGMCLVETCGVKYDSDHLLVIGEVN